MVSLSCSAKEIISYEHFLEDLQKCIKSQWKAPELEADLSTTLAFKIEAQKGLVDDSVEFVQESGNDDFDNLAVSTLKEAGHKCFPSLPSKSVKSVKSEFTFSISLEDSKIK